MSRIIQPQRLDPKDPEENVYVVFEFAALTAAPSSPSVTVTRHAGEADASPSAIKSGDPIVDGSRVLQKVIDGVDGADYLIVRGTDATVRVRAVNKPSDAWEMIVSGESIPSYRARVRIALCEKCGLPPGCPDCRAVHDAPIGA